jgi:hypothetical protein
MIEQDGISVKIIQDSINVSGNRMVTMELEYPRFIHSEILTHRILSKNASSSRAIPVKTLHDHIVEHPAMPVYFGKNEPGMVAKVELDQRNIDTTKAVWKSSMISAIHYSSILYDLGNHKQVANRLVEPYMTMKTLMSGTEWVNLIWLRDHPDAQPEFALLAKLIRISMENSVPVKLKPGQWHLPYVTTKLEPLSGTQTFWADKNTEIDLDQARKISASCCAQVSYRRLDDSIERANKIFDMLNLGRTDVPNHASPAEHQACAMWFDEPTLEANRWPIGYTHIDRDGNYWSGNLKGWVQYRKMIPNEARW